MDHSRLISAVKEFPQVWDRNYPMFREREHKEAAWDKIGQLMNYPVTACKDTFKSLREKYVREREKQTMYGDQYNAWNLLENLTFLDPHIVPRKQQIIFQDEIKPNVDPLPTLQPNFTGQLEPEINPNDFERHLIQMVRKAAPIWDRKSNGYPSKQLKYQLWKNIAQGLKKDVHICMSRWKGLREKYIRQKGKFQEGDGKWEFLDEMAFLDNVIQYRRKQNDSWDNQHNSSNFSVTPVDNFSHNDSGEDSINDSSSDLVIKSEKFDNSLHENSYDSGMLSSGRKRSASDYSESSQMEKQHKIEENRSNNSMTSSNNCISKTPEQVFGDLVATMLAKKTEREKNIAMIEIMQILTK